MLQETYVMGGDGVQLFSRTNNKRLPAIVFIHGWSQTQDTWCKQFGSELNDLFHLVSFDLRGHGYSEHRVGAQHYTDSQAYAADLDAVIRQHRIEKCILVGWSSGSLTIGDYLRHYGNGSIAGVVMVDGLHGLGIETLAAMVGDAPSAYMGDTLCNDFETQYSAMLKCTRDMVREITQQALELMTAQSMMTSPSTRAAMMSRVIDNTEVLASYHKPALIIQGRHDPFVLVKAAQHLQQCLPESTLSIYEKSAHMPFWEEPEKFNRELARFAKLLFGTTLV